MICFMRLAWLPRLQPSHTGLRDFSAGEASEAMYAYTQAISTRPSYIRGHVNMVRSDTLKSSHQLLSLL